MKLTCSRQALHEAVANVGRVAATQTALPILTHILLNIEDDRLCLTASDSELSARTSISVVGGLSESIAAPAKVFGEMLAAMPDGDLEIDSGAQHQLTLSLRDIQYNLRGLPGEEFPSIPVVHVPGDAAVHVEFKQSTMRRLLRQTSFAVSQDQTRVQYTGILFEREEDTFRLISTDGVVRVAVSSAAMEDSGPALAAIVPARTVAEYTRLLKADSEEKTHLYFRNDFAGPTLASFEANGVMLVSRLIEGQFAPWRRVVPTTYTERATLANSDILNALRRMSIYARDDQQRVQVAFSGDAVQLSCFSGSYGEGKERISAIVEGEETLIALQGRFLAEGIDAVGGEGCRIELTTALSPCVVRPLEGDEFLYVQSPMHPR